MYARKVAYVFSVQALKKNFPRAYLDWNDAEEVFGSMLQAVNESSQQLCYIVYINLPKIETCAKAGYPHLDPRSVLVHELMHVVQWMEKSVNTVFDAETAAYLLEELTQRGLDCLDELKQAERKRK